MSKPRAKTQIERLGFRDEDLILDFRYVSTRVANHTGKILTCANWRKVFQGLLDEYLEEARSAHRGEEALR